MKIEYIFYINIYSDFLKIFQLLILFILFSCVSNKDAFDEIEFQKVIFKEKVKYISNNSDFSSDKVKLHYIDGLVLQQQGNYLESIIDFNLALRHDSSAVILYSLSKSYLQINRIKLAEETLLNAIDKDDEFLEAYDLLSEILFNQKKYSESALILNRTLKIDPNSQRQYNLAKIYEFIDLKKSIAIYEELAEKSNNIIFVNKLLNYYKSQNDFKKIIKISNKILITDPYNYKNTLRLLQYYLKDNDYENALRILEHSDKYLISSKLNYAYILFTEALIQESVIDKLILDKFFPKIDNRFHFEPYLHFSLGLLYDKINEPKNIDKHFLHSLKVSTKKSDIPIRICLFYFDNKKYEKVINLINQIDLDIIDADLIYLKGITYLNLDSNIKALSEFKKSILLDSNNLNYLINLASTYDRLKKTDSSEIYYSKALYINPDNALVNNNLAFSFSQRGVNLQKALKMSKKSLLKEPNNSAYLDTYAWINYKLNNLDIALDYLLKSISFGNTSAEVYEHLGDVYFKMKKFESAKKAWKKAIIIDPKRISVQLKIEQNE